MSGMGLSVQIGDFDELREDWEELLTGSANSTIFVTPQWQETWWRHFGMSHDLRILSIRAGDTVIGIAPLSTDGGTITFLGGTDLFDYHEFVVDPRNQDAFYRTLSDYLVALDWSSLVLTSVSEDSSVLGRLPKLIEERGIKVEVEEEDKAPISLLPSSWDEYVAGLNKKNRHELRRKLRRLEATDSFRQYVCDDPGTIAQHMPDFFKLMRASSDEKSEFLTPEREAFFLDVADQLTSRGQFRLYFLEVEGVRVAACICFDYAGSYFLYNSGYDPAFAPLSVGLLNKALSIQDAIQQGKRRFEFLRGTERYKYDLGAVDRSIYRIEAHR